MLELCRKEGVALLVPTIDPELAVLSRHSAQFAAVGTRVVVPAPGVVALANDKLATAAQLLAAGIPTPKSLTLAEYLRDPAQLRQPVIAKPLGGSASVGILRPQRPEELIQLKGRADMMVQEICSAGRGIHRERILRPSTGKLRCAVPHERVEVRSGEVSKGITRRRPALEEAAGKLAQALPGVAGPLCFQAVVTASGEFAVFEINARFGGGYPLAHRAGARFSQWLLEETAGRSLSAKQ